MARRRKATEHEKSKKKSKNKSRFHGVSTRGNSYPAVFRVWLGTYKTEEEAALAYDVALLAYHMGMRTSIGDIAKMNFPNFEGKEAAMVAKDLGCEFCELLYVFCELLYVGVVDKKFSLINFVAWCMVAIVEVGHEDDEDPFTQLEVEALEQGFSLGRGFSLSKGFFKLLYEVWFKESFRFRDYLEFCVLIMKASVAQICGCIVPPLAAATDHHHLLPSRLPTTTASHHQSLKAQPRQLSDHNRLPSSSRLLLPTGHHIRPPISIEVELTIMAEEEPKPLNFVNEIVLKKRRNNEDWANRRKEQLEQRVKKSKSDNFVIKKPEQFIREYRDKEAHLIKWNIEENDQ